MSFWKRESLLLPKVKEGGRVSLADVSHQDSQKFVLRKIGS